MVSRILPQLPALAEVSAQCLRATRSAFHHTPGASCTQLLLALAIYINHYFLCLVYGSHQDYSVTYLFHLCIDGKQNIVSKVVWGGHSQYLLTKGMNEIIIELIRKVLKSVRVLGSGIRKARKSISGVYKFNFLPYLS